MHGMYLLHSCLTCEWQLLLDLNDLLTWNAVALVIQQLFSLRKYLAYIFYPKQNISKQWVTLHHLRLDVWRPWNFKVLPYTPALPHRCGWAVQQ